MTDGAEYYVDLSLLTDPEFPTHILLSALYTKIHRKLAVLQITKIAISFPGYSIRPPTLGRSIRLIGTETLLRGFMDADWMQGIRDQVTVEALRPVPNQCVLRTLRRVQVNSSPARLRRRLIRRHGIDEQEAAARIPDSVAEKSNLPFIQMSSGSTGSSFRLFLKLGPAEQSRIDGEFNSYGLSQNATIPWF